MSKAAIDSAIASRVNAFAIDPKAVTIVGLDTKADESHPLYDERCNAPLDDATVQFMRRKGWTHGAIELRKNGSTLEVVEGRQRVKAAREANRLRTEVDGLQAFAIRAFVRGVDGADALETMIAANELRQADAIVVKAKKAKRLIDLGRSTEHTAQAFGVSTQTINNWMKFFDLSEKVQAAVSAGKVGFVAATALADMTREEQDAALDTLPADAPATGREVKAAKRARGGSAAGPRPGVKHIKRAIAAHTEEPFLSEEFIRALRWVMGELSTKSVKGLLDASQYYEE